MKQLFARRVTLLSGTLLITLLCLVGALAYASYLLLSEFILRMRVRNSIPHVLHAASAERDRLVAAIEAYHSHFGSYPPDHVLSDRPLRIDPTTNQLFYELVGTVYNPTNNMFFTDGAEPLEKATVKEFFNTAEFKNKSTSPGVAKQFLARDFVALREIHDDPDVMVLCPNIVGTLNEVPFHILTEWDFASWQYVSSSPSNNPGKFDLWVELSAAGRKFSIRNWP